MLELLGAAMIYAWVHASVVVVKKVRDTSPYENFILIAAAVAFVLFVVGEIMR